ncbi:MAG: hypothetical protein ACI8ZN_000868 [Bacteroidia bacterium]|jgi:hypothetical protein
MKFKISIALCLLLGSFINPVFSQNSIQDSFNVNVINTSWIGDRNKFTTVENKLQSNSTIVNDEFSLVQSIKSSSAMEWELNLDLDFATSSTNYFDFILFSDSSDLKLTSNVLFLRIGNTKDEVALYHQKNGEPIRMILQSESNITHNFSGTLTLQLDSSNRWNLRASSYKISGFQYDTLLLSNPIYMTQVGFSGFRIKQSTTSFHKKHAIDWIYVGPIRYDTLPPKLKSISSKNNRVFLQFNEPINSASIQSSNFLLEPKLGSPIKLEVHNQDSIVLHFDQSLATQNYELTIFDVKDVVGNRLFDSTIRFEHIQPKKAEIYDVLISEFMADPSPNIGLPEREYIELYNASNEYVNLENWTISDPSMVVNLPNILLPPKSYVFLIDKSFKSEFTDFENVLPLSGLPTLNNASDTLWLINEVEKEIDFVAYSEEWHTENWKKDGGWSLERIDLSKPCLEAENWGSSTSLLGGSPGQKNSIEQTINDEVAPRIYNGYIENGNEVVLQFSENISSYIIDIEDFMINNESPNLAQVMNKTVLKLQFNFIMEEGMFYEMKIENVHDCSGNSMPETRIKLGLAAPPESGFWVINEILFYPNTEGAEFIEIFNASNFVLDLKDLRFGTFDDQENIDVLIPCSSTTRLVFPGEFVVLTSDTAALRLTHSNLTWQHFIQLSKLPNLPNDAGNVFISDAAANIFESFYYDEELHSGFITNSRGVSLERLRYSSPASDLENWQSASYAVNYATPGFQNSQFIADNKLRSNVRIHPDPFSPNGDGYNDFLLIDYAPNNPNGSIQIRIFDASGRMVAHPVNNGLTGVENYFVWDGTNVNGRMLSNGIYILHIEAMDENGQRFIYKKGFTLVQD